MRFEAKNFFDILLSTKEEDSIVHALVSSEISGDNCLDLSTSELTNMNTTWLTNLLTIVNPSVSYTVINSGNICFMMDRSLYVNFYSDVARNIVYSKVDPSAKIRSCVNRLDYDEAIVVTKLCLK